MTIPGSAAQVLAGHIEAFVEDNPDAFVFTSVKGSPLLNRYFAPYWKRALRDAGLEESTRFHDLRHLAGTSAATAGASLREIMARMGHASSDASLRSLKASARRDGEIADAIEQRLNGDLQSGLVHRRSTDGAGGPKNGSSSCGDHNDLRWTVPCGWYRDTMTS